MCKIEQLSSDAGRCTSTAFEADITSAVAQFTNPLFQNHLVVRLDPRKNDSHITFSRGIGYFAESRECAAFAGDSDPQFDSNGKGFTGGHAAAIQAKVGDPLLKLKRGFQVNQFDAGHKRITPTPSAFDTNLDRILDFVSHTFIFPQ